MRLSHYTLVNNGCLRTCYKSIKQMTTCAHDRYALENQQAGPDASFSGPSFSVATEVCFFFFFYCSSVTVVSIFPRLLSPALPAPFFHIQSNQVFKVKANTTKWESCQYYIVLTSYYKNKVHLDSNSKSFKILPQRSRCPKTPAVKISGFSIL